MFLGVEFISSNRAGHDLGILCGTTSGKCRGIRAPAVVEGRPGGGGVVAVFCQEGGVATRAGGCGSGATMNVALKAKMVWIPPKVNG